MLSLVRSPEDPKATGRLVPFVVAGTVLLLAAAFLKLADSVRESELAVRLDRNALDFVVHHRVAWISRIARFATLLGSAWVVVIVILAAAAVLVRLHRPIDALFVALSSAGTAGLVAVVKHVVGRSRPVAADRLVAAGGAAFPSGHAAQSVACYAALAVVVATTSRTTKVRVLAWVSAATIALVVGASRVYLGVHWPSDVVSGWLLAGGWLLTLVGLRATFWRAGRPTRLSW